MVVRSAIKPGLVYSGRSRPKCRPSSPFISGAIIPKYSCITLEITMRSDKDDKGGMTMKSMLLKILIAVIISASISGLMSYKAGYKRGIAYGAREGARIMTESCNKQLDELLSFISSHQSAPLPVPPDAPMRRIHEMNVESKLNNIDSKLDEIVK